MANRHKLLTAFFLMPLWFTNAFSDPGPIWDGSNRPIGYFSGDGSITGSNGNLIGTLRNGIVFNPSGMSIGGIDQSGAITGPGNNVSAGTLKNNIIYDPRGMAAGTIDSDGTTSTRNGSFVIKSPDPRVGAILLLHVLNLK